MGIFLAEELNVMAPGQCKYLVKILSYLGTRIRDIAILIKILNREYFVSALKVGEIILSFMAIKKQ